MKIIKYDGTCNVYVEFQDKYKSIVHCKYQNFKNGYVKNPFDKNVLGIGCIGNTTTRENNKEKKSYRMWLEMMTRCYGNRKVTTNSYNDVIICDEWHIFENFENWFLENYYNINEERMTVDKDILIKGNRIYSPTNCLIVTQYINSLFASVNFNKIRCGTCFIKNYNMYKASCKRIDSKNSFIGYYENIEDAHNAYIITKREVIRQIADKYKQEYKQFPNKVYQAMINY